MSRFSLPRALRVSLGLFALWQVGCGGGSERAQGEPEDAAVAEADARGPVRDADGGAQPPDDADVDPTLPDPSTGTFEPPPAAFDAELEALIAYQREVPPDCPGLLAASSCGNGVCEGLTENPDTCAADCVFHLAGAYNDLPICPSYQERKKASTQAEVQLAVRAAVREGRRVRAVGAQHSASGAICGDGLVLDLSGFADVAATRVEGDIAYVQPGVTLFALGEHLAEQGLGIGLAHLGFRGVTVAGAVGTAAHGSSPLHNHSVSHRLAALTLVLADGSVRTFRERETEPTLWRALQTHLGLLGVVTEVGLYVEPAFDLDTALSVLDEAELLQGEGALKLLEGCDFGQINWFPHQHKALRWCGLKVTSSDRGVRVDNTLLDPGVTPDLAPLAKASFHAGTCDPALNATLETTRYQGLVDNPPLLITETNGTRRVMQVEGPAHRLVSSDLIALGANKYFQMDWEVAVPEPYIQLALETARKVFDAHDVSLPGVGVFLRFGKIERGGWLSYHSSGRKFAEGQTAMFFETPVAVPAGYTQKQLDDYLHIYRELASLFIRHFGARAHWGKNSAALFAEQVKAGTYEGRLDKMNQAVGELDPYGVFANDFASALGIRWPKRDESFARALAGDTCDCGTESEPVCAYRDHHTYANRCRSRCSAIA
ncbi:MAG TPA: FAD-binding protein, partial [Polyangiales bacterium]